METRKVSELKPHSQNELIYGCEPPDQSFVDSISQLQVLEPLLITFDNRIISGHRRWQGARLAGLEEIAVRVFHSRDDTDILEALVHANKHRAITNEMLGRESATLLEVERERAKRRQEGGGDRGRQARYTEEENEETEGFWLEENFPQARNPQSRDHVGEILGVSGKTAEKAAEVVKTIDALTAEGQDEQADQLRETLNKKSVSAAHKEAAAILCDRCRRIGAARDCAGCKALRADAREKKPRPKNDRTEAEVPLDPHGVPIPKRCRDAWCDLWLPQAVELLHSLALQFRAARLSDGLDQRKKHYPFFIVQDFVDGLGMIDNTFDLLLDHIEEQRPAAVCPACAGAGCAPCKLSGLVPRAVYESLKGGAR